MSIKNPINLACFMNRMPQIISGGYDFLSGLIAFSLTIILQPSIIFAAFENFFLFKCAFVYALIVLGVGLFLHTHLENWEKASVNFILKLSSKLLIVTALFYPLLYLMSQNRTVPWALPVHSMLILGVLIGLPRFIKRLQIKTASLGNLGYEKQHELLTILIGSDQATLNFIERAHESFPHYKIIGLVSVSSEVNFSKSVIPVLGILEHLKEIFEKLTQENSLPKRLILTEKCLLTHHIKQIVQVAALFQIPLLLKNEGEGDLDLSLRKLNFEDLIQHGTQIKLNPEIRGYFQKKKILITSACEFLIKELVCLIADCGAIHITLEDPSALELGRLKANLEMIYPDLFIECVVRHSSKVYWPHLIFQCKPEIIFYSALAHHGLKESTLGLQEIFRLHDFLSSAVECKSPAVVILSLLNNKKQNTCESVVDRFCVDYAQYISGMQNNTHIISIHFNQSLIQQEFLISGLEAQQKLGNSIRLHLQDKIYNFNKKSEIVKMIGKIVYDEKEQSFISPQSYAIAQVKPINLIDLLEQSILCSGFIPHEEVVIESINSVEEDLESKDQESLKLEPVFISTQFEWLPEFIEHYKHARFNQAEGLLIKNLGNKELTENAA